MNALPSSRVDFGVNRVGLTQLRRHWLPVGEPWAAALVVHGLNDHSGRYERVGAHLAGAGIETVAFDQRGFGQTGGERGHVEDIEDFCDDVCDHLVELRSLGLPTVLVGHSMGGLVCTRYSVSDRPAPDALVLSAPALRAATPPWMPIAAPWLSRLVPTLRIPSPFEVSMLSRDPAVGAAYDADPLVAQANTVRLGAALFRAMNETVERLDALRGPALVLHGLDDRIVLPSASEPLARCPEVERRTFAGLRHELFQEPEGPQVLAEVVAWLRATLTS